MTSDQQAHPTGEKAADPNQSFAVTRQWITVVILLMTMLAFSYVPIIRVLSTMTPTDMTDPLGRPSGWYMDTWALARSVLNYLLDCHPIEWCIHTWMLVRDLLDERHYEMAYNVSVFVRNAFAL